MKTINTSHSFEERSDKCIVTVEVYVSDTETGAQWLDAVYSKAIYPQALKVKVINTESLRFQNIVDNYIQALIYDTKEKYKIPL